MVLGITSDLEGEEMPVSEEGFKGGDRITIDLPRPEETLRLQGDLTGARKLQEETLDILRRVLGHGAPWYIRLRVEPVSNTSGPGRTRSRAGCSKAGSVLAAPPRRRQPRFRAVHSPSVRGPSDRERSLVAVV